MKNLKLFHLLLLSLLFIACDNKNEIAPSASQKVTSDFLTQIPYCECEKIEGIQKPLVNEPKPIKRKWGRELFTFFEYDTKGRLIKENEYIITPDIGKYPLHVADYEYDGNGKLMKKNIFQVIVQRDTSEQITATSQSLAESIEYLYRGAELVQEKHLFHRRDISNLTTYQYDCKGNLTSKTFQNNIISYSDLFPPSSSSFFKYDCSGNIAKEYKRTVSKNGQIFSYQVQLIAYIYENNLLINKDIYDENGILSQKEIYSYDSEKRLIEIKTDDFQSYVSTITERRNYLNGKLVELIKNPTSAFPTITTFEY